MNCDLSSGVCPNCKIAGIPTWSRNCSSAKPSDSVDRRPAPSSGLGDYVASALDAVGITKQRFEAVVGGPCGCQERQESLNEWGAKHLGIGRVDPPT